MAKGHLTTPGKKQALAGVKGDLWWSILEDGIDDVPKNFTPGLIPILETLFNAAVREKVSKGAVLCRSGVCHIQSVFGFDAGWGCGYRNFQMALTSLESEELPGFPSTTIASGTKDKPRVRTIQAWMKEAWDAGYDPQGLKDFKGSIVGTKKWIGTADLYALAASRGIACKLFNFPALPGVEKQKIKPMHHALMRFVKMYFDGELDQPDFGAIMRINTGGFNNPSTSSNSGQGSATVSAKLPLILQHSGHSRTVVGYEIDDAEEINLIVFDPATSIPRALGKTALEHLRDTAETTIEGSATAAGADSGKRRKLNQQTLRDMLPKSRSEGMPTDPIPVLESDEEMDQAGWVRKKTTGSGSTGKSAAKRKINDRMHLLRNSFDLASNPKATLNHFRVNLSGLSKHDEYQILSFDGNVLLTPEERTRRRTVTATTIFPA